MAMLSSGSSMCSFLRRGVVSLCVSVLFFIPESVGAQTPPPSSSQPDYVPRQYDQPLVPAPSHPLYPSSIYPEEAIKDQVARRFVSGIWVDGVTVYERSDFYDVFEPYMYKEMGTPELNGLINDLRDKYLQDGYILSRVEPRFIDEEILVLQVKEGYIQNVRIQGDIEGPRSIVEGLSKKLTDLGTLSVKDLERYVLLLNDLPGVKARGKVKNNGSIDGGVDFIITLEHKPTEAFVSFSNRHSRYIGRETLYAAVDTNSLLNLYEKLRVEGSVTPFELDELQYLGARYEQPLNSEGTKLEVQVNGTLTKPGGAIESADFEGQSYGFEVAASHPVIRSRASNLKVRGGFSYRDSENDAPLFKLFNILASNDKLRTLFLEGIYDHSDKYRGVSVARLQLRKGFDIIGAKAEALGFEDPAGASPDYALVNGTVLRVQSIVSGLSVMTRGDFQYAFDKLRPAEQFALGGAETGRAYDPAEISGDHGLSGVVELRYGQDMTGYGLRSYQAYTFYDLGAVWQRDFAGSDAKQTLASTGFGVRLKADYDIDADLSVGFPLTRDVSAEGSKGSDPRYFLTLGKKF